MWLPSVSKSIPRCSKKHFPDRAFGKSWKSTAVGGSRIGGSTPTARRRARVAVPGVQTGRTRADVSRAGAEFAAGYGAVRVRYFVFTSCSSQTRPWRDRATRQLADLLEIERRAVMIRSHHVIQPFIQRVDTAVARMAREYRDGYVADEDDFTSRFLERIESELDGWMHDGIVFKIRKTKSRSSGAEEAIFGADIVAAVNVDLSDYKKEKGILIQAKRLDRGKELNSSEWKRLQEQIGKMEKHTPESYVWLYDSSGVRSIKSHVVSSLMTRRPDDLYVTKCATFLGDLVKSKHGDPRIKDVRDLDRLRDVSYLDWLRDEFEARSAVSISVSDNDLDHEKVS